MRLHYMMELVLALGVGLGLARYRLTWPEQTETGDLSWVGSFEIGVDSIFAGVGLASGLATFVERVRGKSPVPWGPGRWVWFVVASYLLLTTLDRILVTVAIRFQPGIFIQNSLSTEIIRGLRGRYGEFLLQPMTWFLSALGLTFLAGRTQHSPILDEREWGGRVFAAVLVSTGLGLRALVLLGIRPLVMGGSR